MAGFNLRLFAHVYPGEVAGLVFVDATPEDVWSRWEAARSPEEWSQLQTSLDGFWKDLPDGALAERNQLDRNQARIRGVGLPSSVPITILTNTCVDESYAFLGITASDMAIWLALQLAWTREAPQSRHVVTRTGGHYIQHNEPELVISAIRDVLREIEADNGSGEA
jgi:pimeloyl-ACP methyl ester carboxylesterase